MRCIFTNRTIGIGCFSIGTNGPSVWRIVSVCVYWTCVHYNPFYKFFNGQKLAQIRLFFTCDPRNRENFELQTVLQSVREFIRSLKTGCTGQKFVRTRGVILCGPCKEHTEKEVSKKNNEGKGYGVRVVETLVMVLFNKSSLRVLTLYQFLVNPMNGFFFDSSCQQSINFMEMRSDSDEIIS